MPFNRPSIEDIKARVLADLRTRLPGVEPKPRRSDSGALGMAIVGVADGLHAHLEWLYRQLFADTADPENLERHAARKGITRKAATYAAGPIVLTGTEATEIPQGTELTRADGALYATTAGAYIDQGSATVEVEALVAGLAGEALAGAALTLVSPIAGINSSAYVTAPGLTGGAEEESDVDLLARYLQAEQETPDGGSATDYRRWALAADPQATRVFVVERYPHPGAVTVVAVNDQADPPLPDAEALARIETAILAAAPVTDTVVVRAPIAQQVDFVLSVTPNTPEVRAAVEAELRSAFRRVAVCGQTTPLSSLRTAVGLAVGLTDYAMTVPNADAPATSYAHLHFLGTIQWVA